MVDSSERYDDPSGTPDEPGRRSPDHRATQPWLQDDPESAGSSPATADDTDDGPPWLLEAIGQIGIYIGIVSVGLTVFGIPAMYVGLQPYGNVAITLAIAGVSVAMVLGMVYQAYVSDSPFGNRGDR